MLNIVELESVFEPQRRTQRRVNFRSGERVSAYTPSRLRGVNAVVWRNGSLVMDGDPEVSDGDFLHFAPAITGTFAPLVPILFWGAFITVASRILIAALLPKVPPVQDELGGQNYSYYGFRNAYRPEGDALPVVYGKMRVAPPCINQSVTGDAPVGSQISHNERLNSMYAISQGPILGLGSYQGDVFNQEDFNDIVGTGSAAIAERIGFHINGIDGRHIPTIFQWRTGGGTQEPIRGLLGAGSLPVTDAGTSYDLQFEIPNGTAAISELDKPVGVYPYASRIVEVLTEQFVSQLLTTKADLCNVQLLWEGLFSGGEDGTPDNATATIRIQYWRTDSTGATTGDVVLLPAIEVTNASNSVFTVDVPFTLFDPPTYLPVVQQGYAAVQNFVGNLSSIGLDSLRPGTGDPGNLQFTFACFFYLRQNLWLLSWTNNTGQATGQVAEDLDSFLNPDTPDVWPDGSSWFGIRTTRFASPQVDDFGGDDGDIYVIVEAYEKTAAGYAASWWRSTESIGNAQPPLTDWPGASPEKHITLSYDGSNWTSTGGLGLFHCYIDGVEIGFRMGEAGVTLGSGHAYDGSTSGFLWKGGVINYDHVSPPFPTLNLGPPSNVPRADIGVIANSTQFSRGGVAQVLLHNGLVGGSDATVAAWANQAANQRDPYNNRSYDIRSMPDDPAYANDLRICLPLDDSDVTGGGFEYRNFAFGDQGLTNFQFSGPVVQDVNGPVWFGESGVPTKDHYFIEVFKQSPSFPAANDPDDRDDRDRTTVDTITTWATQDYNYPFVAYLATSIRASEQINSSEPNITAIVHGKKLEVWQGGDVSNPVFDTAWSNNPSWVALDMITAPDYGLGAIFAPTGGYENVDLPAFLAWAEFCDEGVPDAFGSRDLFGFRTSDLNGGSITLFIGTTDVASGIPENWAPGKYQSIATITDGTINQSWVTADDFVQGTNQASNRLLVTKMEFVDAPAPDEYHTWSSYLAMECRWNRQNSSNEPSWPSGHNPQEANFTSSGSWVVPADVTEISVLVVGGGGGGGHDDAVSAHGAGGGGGGGVCYTGKLAVTPGDTWTVTVGGGGAGGTSGASGTDGAASTLISGSTTIQAEGGGGGGGDGLVGEDGGSGGGGGEGEVGGAATQDASGGATGFGAAGGTGYTGSGIHNGGGGGGSGEVGADGTADASGKGGDGVFIEEFGRFGAGGGGIGTDGPADGGADGGGSAGGGSGADGFIAGAGGGANRTTAGGDGADGAVYIHYGNRKFADAHGKTVLGTSGQYEKRCTFDGVFDQQERSAWDALIDVFQTGRAMPVKLGRKIVPVWDRPRDPVAMYTMANIVEGSLEMSYLSPEVNPNSLEVEILDADNGYERRTVLVDHDSIQNPAAFGQVRKERSSRLGITRRSQAIRDAYYRLNRYNLQLRSAKFEVGPDAINALPGDRILLSHDVPQYGYSGRLAADIAIYNIHPGSRDLVAEWTQNGGASVITAASLLVADSTTPPLAGFTTGAALAYALPTANSVGKYYPALQVGGDGYNGTLSWSAQMVTVADGLYPFPGNTASPLAPFDRIDGDDQVKEYSVYLKEPAYGASESVRLNIYRYLDADGEYVRATHAVRFDWNSGNLEFGAREYSPGDSSPTLTDPYGLSHQIEEVVGTGWWRATVWYDNDTAANGAGSAADGDYIQARVYYSYATDQSVITGETGSPTFLPSPSGRNNQLLRFGDPLSLDGNMPNGTTKAWTQINGSVGTNSIGHDTGQSPPFYPDDTGTLAGTRGYVVNMKNSEAFGGANQNPIIQQNIVMPGDWPNPVYAVGSLQEQAICCTIYVRLKSDNAATNPTLYVRVSTEDTTTAGGYLNGDGAQCAVNFGSDPPTITFDVLGSVSEYQPIADEIALVRQTSTTDDTDDWYQVNFSWEALIDWPTDSSGQRVLYTQIMCAGNSGGDASVQFWGPRIHGEAGTLDCSSAGCSATNRYVIENAHRGTLMWGSLYNSNADTAAPTAFEIGARIQLDRPVTIAADESYEVYVRSTRQPDALTGGDTSERIFVSEDESGLVSARTEISVSSPRSFTPTTGDIYSFGQLDKAVEDLVVTEINTNTETMRREIKALEYVEDVYTDTDFGTMGDLTVSDLAPPTAGGSSALYGFGGSGPQGSSFNVSATATPYRDQNAKSCAAIEVTVTPPRGTMPYKEVRLWISQLSDKALALGTTGRESSARHIATLPFSVQSYRYDDTALDPDFTYRIRAQRVGWRGTGPPLPSCPFVDVTPVVTPPLLGAPSVEIDTDGFSQIYTVTPQSARAASVEGRVGGWIISTPAFSVLPDDRVFTTQQGISIGATNSKGATNFPVVSRSQFASGRFGQAVSVTTSAAFRDESSTQENIAEDDFAANLVSIPADLEVALGVLQWNETTPSTALGPVYAEMNEIDLTTAKRALPVALIEGSQVRPETLADLTFTLGSEKGRRWSLEGPMDDFSSTPENASVKIQWRWTSGSSLAAETYRDFEPKEVLFRKCQMRLVWTRPTASFQVRLTRFTLKCYVAPLFDPGDVDGGTF